MSTDARPRLSVVIPTQGRSTLRRRLVSVTTPTWQRRDLLLGAIMNVREQTYRPLEHVIVSDGIDDDTYQMVDDERQTMARLDLTGERLVSGAPPVPITFVELGRHWTGILKDSYAAAPLTVACFLARGSYQTWLADDERMEPDHVASLVDLLEDVDADFTYGKVRMHRVGQNPEHGYVIGSDPPEHGQITNVLYRAELLARGLYQFGDDRAGDWKTIEQWLARGARCAFLDRVTLTHRIDR